MVGRNAATIREGVEGRPGCHTVSWGGSPYEEEGGCWAVTELSVGDKLGGLRLHAVYTPPLCKEAGLKINVGSFFFL